MPHPLISVVINNFNYAAYLRQAIESALGQAYPSFEVLVVDDGSTDGSREILRSYGKSVVPVLKENGGQTSTFNAGFRASQGGIVYFLDADDHLLPGALARMAGPFYDPACVKAHWPLRVVDGDGLFTGELQPRQPLPAGDLREEVVRGGPGATLWPPTSGNAFARRFLEAVLPLPEIEREYHLGSASADAFLSVLAPLYGSIAAIPEPQSCYRIHASNDYATMSPAAKVARDLVITERLHDTLSGYCARFGIEADREAWKERSWPHRLHQARHQVIAHVPDGARFILMDEDHWGRALFPRHQPFPFLENEGEYWGPPQDDEQAIGELERLRRSGAAALVVGWPAFWWLDHYQGFHGYVQSSFPCVSNSPVARVYALDR